MLSSYRNTSEILSDHHFPVPSEFIMAIYNIVLYKFKSEATSEQRKYVKELIEELPSRISTLQSVITGEKIFNPLDHGYDMGAIFLFESKDKLNEFRPHQAHADYKALSSPYLEGTYIKIVNRLDHIAKELSDKMVFDIETA
ncbi:hypothetical protein BDR07DRAFT_791447 [Suillus spraguei]|nr:hypothetical protein BDR07DRAFT_791447 [Suillus spraguei]